MMRLPRSLVALALAGLTLFGIRATSHAGTFYTALLPGMAQPGLPAANTDIMIVSKGKLYVADRTNSTVDVYSTATNKFLTALPVPAPGLPNGIFADDGRQLFFVGNGAIAQAGKPGNSTIIMMDASGNILDSFFTGGLGRVDEGAVDPVNQLVVAANDQDTPPFLTTLSYATGKLTNPIKTSVFRAPLNATAAGIEQTQKDPLTGLFFTAFPSLGGSPFVLGFNPTTMAQRETYPLPGCTGSTGLAIGAVLVGGDSIALVGCGAGAANGGVVILDLVTGKILQTYPTVGSPDEVYYTAAGNIFFTVSNTAGFQSFTAISGIPPFQIIESDAVGLNHNVAADNSNGNAYVLLRVGNPTCAKGCILPFLPNGSPQANAIPNQPAPFVPSSQFTPNIVGPFNPNNVSGPFSAPGGGGSFGGNGSSGGGFKAGP